MESNKTASRMHPLVAGAAISVMLVSLTGVAAMTGMFPNSHGSSAATSGNTVSGSIGAALLQSESNLAHADSATPHAPSRLLAASDGPPSTAQAASQPGKTSQASTASVVQAATICKSCGRVESIQVIKQAAAPSGVGMVAGAVLGGVLGNQIGDGSGRKIATVAGAVGGGYAGNEVEKRARASTSYQVRVRMENGVVRSFPYAEQPAWSEGDRVRIVKGKLTARA